MHSVDKYLADAIIFIKNNESDFFDEKKQIPKVYKGYVASFGTIIKHSGLLPAVVLFANQSETGEKSKKPVLDAIFYLLKAQSGLVKENHKNMVDLATDGEIKKSPWARKETLNAAIALKLALRTFKIEK